MTRYGEAKSPQPTRNHTCKIRRRLERGWSNPTSQDDCPACQVDRREGWQELLASFRDGLMGDTRGLTNREWGESNMGGER